MTTKPWPAHKRQKPVAERVSTTAISLRKLKADARTKAAPIDKPMSKAEELFADISAFQRKRQDLPQAHFLKLSKSDQKKVSNAYRIESARPMLDAVNTPEERAALERMVRTRKFRSGPLVRRSKKEP
jgi:hypothetical protein